MLAFSGQLPGCDSLILLLACSNTTSMALNLEAILLEVCSHVYNITVESVVENFSTYGLKP